MCFFPSSSVVTNMLPAQVANVAEAALPPPPSSRDFLAGLRGVVSRRESPAVDAGLFGDLFSKDPNFSPGAKPNQLVALAAAEDFEKVRAMKQVSLEKLDDWLAAFAKFVLSPRCLFDNETDQNQCMLERLELCEHAGVQSRQWVPATLKTNVNALSALYKMADSHGAVVSSVPNRFPNYCAIFNASSGTKTFHPWLRTNPCVVPSVPGPRRGQVHNGPWSVITATRLGICRALV